MLEASRRTLSKLEFHTLWGLCNRTNPPPHPEPASRFKMRENTHSFAPRLEKLAYPTTSTPQTSAQSPHSTAKVTFIARI